MFVSILFVSSVIFKKLVYSGNGAFAYNIFWLEITPKHNLQGNTVLNKTIIPAVSIS